MTMNEMENGKLTFLDLFSGIGGFRLGMESAGHKCVGYVEWDKYARKSYEAIHNVKGEWTAHDITTVSDNDFRLLRGKVDVICGGFPCQAFSVAGKRGGFSDTRGTLFFDIARAAKQIKPRFLFLENVKGLLSHDKGNTFGTILYTLDELGYDVEWQVLNSKNFGVPQNRERVFIIGHFRGTSRGKVFPIKGTSGTINNINLIAHRKGYRRNTQVFDPEGITEALDTGQGGGRGHYTIEKTQFVEFDRNNGIGKELDVAITLNASDWRGLNRNQKQNAVVQAVLTPDRINKRQNGRRIKEEGEPMFTLTAQDRHGIAIREATKKGYNVAIEGDGINLTAIGSKTRRGRVGKQMVNTLDTSCNQGVLINDGEEEVTNLRIRKLTPRECWRLQGFPDWAFDKAKEVNSDSQLYKQAGNSVTVNVIAEIAKSFQ